jgi:predicted DNA-binding transcriptional regulator AlpA
MLNEFCATTGLHRKAATRLLNQKTGPRAANMGRPRLYGPELIEPLRLIWETGDRMSGKLLRAVMPELVASLERHGELKVQPEVRDQLLSMSAATIDRLLRRRTMGSRHHGL